MSAKDLVHIIDDDDALRDSLAFLLSSAGIEAKSYDSATAYLVDAQRGASGCIVTDVRMPGMSGIDLLRRLKSDGIPVPVIVMTGHADVPLAVEAMKLGAFDFVEKPFDDDVRARIRAGRARSTGKAIVAGRGTKTDRCPNGTAVSARTAGAGWVGRRQG